MPLFIKLLRSHLLSQSRCKPFQERPKSVANSGLELQRLALAEGSFLRIGAKALECA